MEQLDTRLQYSGAGLPEVNPILIENFRTLRESLEERIAAKPNITEDVHSLLRTARRINTMEHGQGVPRSEVAEILFLVEDADKLERWKDVQSEYYELCRAAMNYVGGVNDWEYLAGVSLGPPVDPDPPAAG
jgi:hypothetical protein